MQFRVEFDASLTLSVEAESQREAEALATEILQNDIEPELDSASLPGRPFFEFFSVLNVEAEEED